MADSVPKKSADAVKRKLQTDENTSMQSDCGQGGRVDQVLSQGGSGSFECYIFKPKPRNFAPCLV